MEARRELLAYSRCAFWISSSLKVALIGTEIFPDLSHSKSNSRSGMKFFDERRRPKNVVRLPDQKNRFFDNSLRIAGNAEGRARPPPASPAAQLAQVGFSEIVERYASIIQRLWESRG